MKYLFLIAVCFGGGFYCGARYVNSFAAALPSTQVSAHNAPPAPKKHNADFP